MASATSDEVQLGPSSRDKDARMRALAAAAVDLFSEEGYSAVSTRRIAERAGCSETLLFRYFGDKRGLLLAICNDLGSGGPTPRAESDATNVREFIEGYFLTTFDHFRRDAPALKVVISALINDPEMTADFEQRHDLTVEYVVSRLRELQQANAIAPHIDVVPVAISIEQLSFSLGFMLQLIFQRSRADLEEIARTFAFVLSQGLQAEAPQPLLEPGRQKALATVLDARQRLDRVIELLEDGASPGRASTRSLGRGHLA